MQACFDQQLELARFAAALQIRSAFAGLELLLEALEHLLEVFVVPGNQLVRLAFAQAPARLPHFVEHPSVEVAARFVGQMLGEPHFAPEHSAALALFVSLLEHRQKKLELPLRLPHFVEDMRAESTQSSLLLQGQF